MFIIMTTGDVGRQLFTKAAEGDDGSDTTAETMSGRSLSFTVMESVCTSTLQTDCDVCTSLFDETAPTRCAAPMKVVFY